jgi:extracellular factor (EF) 3-hydroxypalmitic acid methyl ester biosynthesis protein
MVPRKDKATLLAALGHVFKSGRLQNTGSDSVGLGLTELLDRTYESLVAFPHKKVDDSLDILFELLTLIRQTSSEDSWREKIKRIRRHRLFSLLLHDPLTYRCFHKPRGHAADPVMLDLVYRDGFTLDEISDLGARLWSYMAARPLAEALRNRRDWLAAQIDATAERTGGTAEVLAIEAGHMREAHRSRAFQTRALRRFVALDRDVQAIGLIERELGHSQVTAIHTPTYAVLSGGRSALGYFDFIYSVSLFERLDEPAAVRGLAAVFETLKAGGSIWLSNLSPSLREAAYLESFMNWWPTYRDGPALERLATAVPSSEVLSMKTALDPTESIVSLELTHC